jgi:hypothetical protein
MTKSYFENDDANFPFCFAFTHLFDAAIHNMDRLPIPRTLSFLVCRRDATGRVLMSCPVPSLHHRGRPPLTSGILQQEGRASVPCAAGAAVQSAYFGGVAYHLSWISGKIIHTGY